MTSLENLTPSNYHESNWLYYHDEKCPRKQGISNRFTLFTLSCPCNHELKFLHNYPRFNEIIENLNYFCYDELKCLRRYSSFDDVTWKFVLPLLLRGKVFTKNKAVLLLWLQISHAPIILLHHELNFGKNMTNFMKWLENLDCSHYHELKFSQK